VSLALALAFPCACAVRARANIKKNNTRILVRLGTIFIILPSHLRIMQ
jgi:hypothetical protein